jgi:hypothetical protein
MNLFFSPSKITPQLTSERLKGYKWIIVGQFLLMISFLFGYEFFHQYPSANGQQILVALIGLLMIGLNILSYELIKDLTDNKTIRRLEFFLLWSGVIMGLGSSTDLIDKNSALNNFLAVFSIAFALIAFIILLYFTIYDIFNEKHDITYRLWGSASIYMLLGATFGVLYMLLSILLPDQFRFNSEVDLFRFASCYSYSFYTLSGIDSPFENFGLLIRNVSVIESVFSNLYIVLVVGRLLSK